jgi:hypothetical protein
LKEPDLVAFQAATAIASNFDQELFAYQPIDYQQGIWRVFACRVNFGEKFLADRHEAFDILGMHDVGCELGHARKAEPFAFERARQILEHLAHLDREIGFANQLAGFVHRELTGNKYQLGSRRPGDMTICAQRFGQAGWIAVFHCRLRHTPPCRLRNRSGKTADSARLCGSARKARPGGCRQAGFALASALEFLDRRTEIKYLRCATLCCHRLAKLARRHLVYG